MLSVPQRGLVTGQGFKPLISVAPPLCDASAERERVFSKIGRYLDMVKIAHNDILVGKYVPEKTGSLLTASETQNEARWQSKCGLVLKYGPKSKDDGFLYDVGDWVYYRPSDGVELGLKCENDRVIVHCLILSPAHVIGSVDNPDILW